MKRKIMALCLSVLAFGSIGGGVAIATQADTASTAQIASFQLPGAQVKFAKDAQYNGIRFPVFMSDADYETYVTGGLIEYTGAVLCTPDKLSDGKLTKETEGATDFDTTAYWKDGDGWVDASMQSAAFLYEIPDTKEAETQKIAAVAYYKLKGDATVYYTEPVEKSVAEVASLAYQDRNATVENEYVYETADGDYSPYTAEQLNLLLEYMPTYTVTYSVNGETTTETVYYGLTAEKPADPEIAGYAFKGWTSNNTAYDFATAVTGDITITATLEKAYAYAENITLRIESEGAGVAVEEELTSESKWIKKFTKTGDAAFTAIYVNATGLKANTTYGVRVTVDTDGTGVSFYNPNNAWFINTNLKTFVLDTVTDENGALETSTRSYFGGGTYAKFTDVTVMEYVYGNGVTVSAGVGINISAQGGEAIDGGKYVKTLSVPSEGGTSLTIAATKHAGLQANAKYVVSVAMETDRAYPAYYSTDNAWLIGSDQSRPCSFEITTDANGEFVKSYANVYCNGTQTVKYTGITIEKAKEYAYGTGISVTPEHNGYTVADEKVTVGVNAGKYIKTLANVSNTNGTFGGLKIAATNEAGLKANTNYTVTVTVDITTSDSFTGWVYYQANNQFLLSIDSPSFSFTVTTDENGAFTQEYGSVYAALALKKIAFTSVMLTEATA